MTRQTISDRERRTINGKTENKGQGKEDNK